MSYVALYRSATSGTTGCVKRFATVEKETMLFPPQVSYECDMCGTTHGFRLERAALVSTPRQRQNIERFCVEQGLDRQVEVT